MWRTLALALLVLPGGMSGSDYVVLRETKVGQVVEATLLFSSGVLTEATARDCFERYSSQIPIRSSLLSVKLIAERNDAGLALEVLNKCHTPSECRDALRAAPQPKGAVADVLRSRTGVVMRYRPVSGSVRRLILEGSDPSQFNFGRSSFQMVFLTVSAPTPLFRDRPYEGRRVEIYFKTPGSLNQSDCEGLTVGLSKQLDAPFVRGEFRADAFFLSALLYPYTYLLAGQSPLPDEQWYAKSQQTTCWMTYGKLDCVTSVGDQVK